MTDDGWSTVKPKKLTSSKPVSNDTTPQGPTSMYEAIRPPPRFNAGAPRPGALPGAARTGTPQNFPRGTSGQGSSGFGGFGNKREGGLAPMVRPGGRTGGRVFGSQEPTSPQVAQVDYFAQEELVAAEMVPKDETKEVESLDVAYMMTVAHLVHKFRSTVVIPEQILKLNLDMGRRGDRGDRSTRNGGGFDSFQRGMKSNLEEPGFGDGRGLSASNNQQPTGGDPGASSFARGQKSYTQASTNQGGKGGFGGKGGRGREEDCDPNLVIERITLTDIVEDENSPAAPAVEKTGEEGDEADKAEEEAMASGFVRRQAKRKLNESDDERVKRQLRGLLNKLTSANYDGILAKTVGENGISTPEQLEFFIKLVYEKASQMEKFLQTYAKLMVDIESAMVEKKVIGDDTKAFKGIVVNAAQEMYTKVITQEFVPDADLDDEDKFNATVLRKNERKGLACFIAILTTTPSTSADAKKSAGLIARKVNHNLMVDSFANSTNERNIEFIMSLFGAYMEDMNSPAILVDKARDTMNKFIADIEKLCNETDEAKKLPLRHQMLMENLVHDWNQVYRGY